MKSRILSGIVVVVLLMLGQPARASLFQGEALDTVAEYVSWGAIIIAPITLITVFWLVHILPEKIAEKKKHPQAKAIQVLCLLSLAFGGLLWPLAWLWAYSKPVLYKMAYGTDQIAHEAPPADTGRTVAGEGPPAAPGRTVVHAAAVEPPHVKAPAAAPRS